VTARERRLREDMIAAATMVKTIVTTAESTIVRRGGQRGVFLSLEKANEIIDALEGGLRG
jgi:hypothetical protein